MIHRSWWRCIAVLVCTIGMTASTATAQWNPLKDWLSMPLTGDVIADDVVVPIAVTNDAGDEGVSGGKHVYGDAVYYELPATVNGLPSVSFRVQIPAHDDVHDTYATLAFIINDSGRIDVEALMEAVWERVGREPILVPYLQTDYCDLHVGVDLNAWGAAGLRDAREDFEVGDWISLDATGQSSRLPGFLVSDTAINFAPHKGFATNYPYDGDVRVGGFYGLQIVPEPSAMLLLVTGLGAFIARRRKR